MIGMPFRRLRHRLGARPVDGRFLQVAEAALFGPHDLPFRSRSENEAIIRRMCANYYIGGHDSLCRVFGRYKMLVDTQDMAISAHLLSDGYWEMWHTEAMVRLLKPGMTAVDIGANLGYFTLLMSDLVGPGGSVHAFEPNAEMVRRLQHSVAINGFEGYTTVHRTALYDRAGESLLAVPDKIPGGSHVIADVRGRVGESIMLERFDAIPALADADYIKMDVEGSEDAVWRGMRGFLARGRPLTVVMEFAAARYADAPGFVDQMLADGFSLALLEPDGIVPVDPVTLLSKPMVEQLLLLRR